VTALQLEQVRVDYGVGSGASRVVDSVDFEIASGSTLGLIGESGSGKTTIARAIVGLARVSGGRILLDGLDVTNARGETRRVVRRHVGMVFQDSYASLNPRRTIGAAIREAIVLRRGAAAARRPGAVAFQLDRVGLGSSLEDRFPHQLSGGQRQRAAIARALAREPAVLILDEVTSALDVSVQASILTLLRRLQRELGLTYLVISHDMTVVGYLCARVSVLYLGDIVEQGAVTDILSAPAHPYTRVLLDAVPRLADAGSQLRLRIHGVPPDPQHPPSGCRFHPRCPIGPGRVPGREACSSTRPRLEWDGAWGVACHFPLVNPDRHASVGRDSRTLTTEDSDDAVR
jgi:peptide/nickel transport system ATP-binding protein